MKRKGNSMSKFILCAVGFTLEQVGPVELWIKDIDFDGEDGGHFDLTTDKNRTKKFDTQEETLSYWNTQSKVFPLRPDGEPNRPLTALSCAVYELKEEKSN
jgi:hypothetical protein